MAISEIGALRVRMAINAGEFTSGARKAESAMASLAGQAKLLGAALGAAFITRFATEQLRNATQLWIKQDQAIRAVEATLKTTGATAGFTSKQLQDIASELQEVSTFGDEDILKNATNNLLTFGNVVGPIFVRAQEAALDLSAVLKQDLKSSAIQLGKALNDPILGITALSRVGIAFTKSQKEQIKGLVLQNKVMEAQSVILDEVEKFYGDAAEAAARGAGIFIQAANSIGDAWEDVGETIGPVTLRLAAGAKAIAQAFQSLSPEVKRFIVFGTSAALIFGSLAIVAGVVAVALGSIAAPLAAAVAGVGLLAGTIASQWRGITNIAASVGEAFQGVFTSAKKYLVDLFAPVIDRFVSLIRGIVSVLNRLRTFLGFDEIQTQISSALSGVTDVIQEKVDKIKEIWNRGAEDNDAAAAELAPKMVKPMLSAADLAALAATKTSKSVDVMEQAMQRLVDKGQSLADELKTPFDIQQENIRALEAAHARGAISADQFAAAQRRAAFISQNSYASMASSIASSLQQAFGNSKGVAIASAIINSYEAFTKALATYPPPFSYAAAAAALAAGFAQVRNIQNTNSNSRTASASGSSSSAAVAPQTAAEFQTTALSIEGINSGDLFSRETVIGILDTIDDITRDGGRVIIAGT